MKKGMVAPRRGAWIEMETHRWKRVAEDVAPRRGAWIEMCQVTAALWDTLVAPRRGAWIEIWSERHESKWHARSPLAEGRGLKCL